MESETKLVINGSFGEGGGQVLRNSLALSILTGREIRIENIRANRTPPGLRPQHLAAVKGAASISGAEVVGDEIGSSVIDFRPGPVTSGDHVIDIGTAGSLTLLLQTLLPPLLSASGPSSLRLIGGTDVSWSPPIDYLRYVFLPKILGMGAKVDIELERRGFYPRGGGEILVSVEPGSLSSGEFLPDSGGGDGGEKETSYKEGQASLSIEGRVFLGNLPNHIGKRMREAVERELAREFNEGLDINITIDKPSENERSAIGQGTGITLWSGNDSGTGYDSRPGMEHLGATGLGSKGMRAEKVGSDAARELIHEIRGGCGMDIHAADQLPVFVPLITASDKGGRLAYTVREITGHLRSALWVLEQFGYPSTVIDGNGFHVKM
jgi:RNA 3'-terminal phosphate cyclase (ATP)